MRSTRNTQTTVTSWLRIVTDTDSAILMNLLWKRWKCSLRQKVAVLLFTPKKRPYCSQSTSQKLANMDLVVLLLDLKTGFLSKMSPLLSVEAPRTSLYIITSHGGGCMFVYHWTDSEYSIEKYRRKFAMRKLRKNLIGEWISPLSKNFSQTRSVWSWSEIDRPSSMSICCGRTVFYSSADQVVCNHNSDSQCIAKFSRVKTNVIC